MKSKPETLNRTIGFAALLLFGCGACATHPSAAPNSLATSVRRADFAYRNLPTSLPAYNLAVRELCAAMEAGRPESFAASLGKLEVTFDFPKVGLPLRHVEIAPPFPPAIEPQAGIPMVLGYDTKDARLYPPEGLFVDGTAVYGRVSGQPRFSILAGKSDVWLNGRTYPLASHHNAAGDHLKFRAKRFAASGFSAMIRPLLASRKPQIYLLDPY
ncbi:MAG: hypothetical protein JO333_01390, partial [Verrucomicrobia bacterium]|nr:hypothetical protein [Verrucomicrobiota bacterium]